MDRVLAGLPRDVRERLQQSAATLRGDEGLEPFSVPPDTWGFCRVVEPAALRSGTAAPTGAWAAQLEQCQAFEAPDCVERMARVYGVPPHATLISPQSAVTTANAAALAGMLKQETASAWAAEAVRRGVAHAKGGDLEAALRCYAQALELDAQHLDAHVARGAALANGGRLREGREACEAALRLDPTDRNAKQYLDAIVAKMAAQAAPPSGAEAADTTQAVTEAPETATMPSAALTSRAIEPPGPMAPPAAAGAPPARPGKAETEALNEALRAAADKLRRKHKHSRKHDGGKKKTKKHKKEKKKRRRSSSRSSSGSSSSDASR